jgi:hypothetical protein
LLEKTKSRSMAASDECHAASDGWHVTSDEPGKLIQHPFPLRPPFVALRDPWLKNRRGLSYGLRFFQYPGSLLQCITARM